MIIGLAPVDNNNKNRDQKRRKQSQKSSKTMSMARGIKNIWIGTMLDIETRSQKFENKEPKYRWHDGRYRKKRVKISIAQ